MKKIIIVSILLVCSVGFILWYASTKQNQVTSPVENIVEKITEKPLAKYSFERLREQKIQGSNIEIKEILKKDEDFISLLFYFAVDGIDGKEDKQKVSGLMNIPTTSGDYPLILMFRGFVPKENFTTGEGTRRSGEELAKNGFITVAPDFLGYGASDNPSELAIEERFQTYTTSLSLVRSVATLNDALSVFCQSELVRDEKVESLAESTSETPEFCTEDGSEISADTEKIGIWGHSNGGHISLATLAITGKDYPTVLWNPVTKPFPYSILYFTDEFEDNGKALRKVVADFEKEYDAEEYSPHNYYTWITAPIYLHQAGDDEAVPLRWSNQFYDQMQEMGKDIDYITYPGENHNFNLGSWSLAIQRSATFYKSRLASD